MFELNRCRLTLKNLLLYNLVPGAKTFYLMSSGLTLVDVKLFGSEGAAMFCHTGCEVEVTASTFVDCAGVDSMESKVRFYDCHWQNPGRISAYDSELSVFHSSMFDVGSDSIMLLGKVEATFQRCEIFARSSDASAFWLEGRARLSMEGCGISGFNNPFTLNNFGSKAELRKCKLVDCGTALICAFNSSASMVDCEIEADVLLALLQNPEGRVEFLRNSFRSNPRLRSPSGNI